MEFPALYGVLLTSICGCTVICSMYTTKGNYKTPINRLFGALSLCLIFWSFGYAVTLTAATETISIIGRRISPIGWGLVFGFFLHYVLLLTGREKLLAEKWVKPALYLPGTATVIAYSVLPEFGLNEDRLVRTNLGWVSAARMDAWDIFLYCYAVLFIVLAVALLFRWGKSGTKSVRRQSQLLLLAISLSSLLGICTDNVPQFFHKAVPQISAVFIFLPIFAISYCVERYGFMRPGNGTGGEIILNDEKRKDLYRYMSAACVLGGTITAVATRFFDTATEQHFSIILSVLLILFGIYILLISRMNRDEALKEALIAAVLTALIPGATLWLANSVWNSIWVFIFPLLILCLLFNRKIILTTVIFISILTQILLYVMLPTVICKIDNRDYFLRLFLICMCGYLAYYVNHVYIQRLQENSDYTESRALMAKISRSFISVTAENFDALFTDMLRLCSRHIRCDKAFGVVLDPSGQSIFFFREWSLDGVETLQEDFRSSFPAIRSFFLRQFREKSMYVLADAERLPDTVREAKNRLLGKTIRSLVCLPIKSHEKIVGFLGFGAAYPIQRWNLRSLSSLEIIANTAADAVVKVHAERKMRFMAYHDQLTGLPNRLLFRNTLAAALQTAKQDGTMVGVVFLDLDSFKSINDTLGHDMGDQLLVEVSEKIAAAVGKQNMVSRFGGDEFVFLLNGLAKPEEMPPILQRLINLVHKPVILRGQEFFVTSSAGAALFPRDAEDADSLIRYADMAMYRAKKLGKDRYMLCSSEIKAKEMEEVRLTNLLYRAQEKDQLLLYYQPQVHLQTNTIVGMETLLRWNLPERSGLVSPAVFIPLAEKTGLIQPIGEWVLRTACTQCKRWREMGLPEIRIAVNVSLLQLRNPNFPSVVSSALKESGLPAGLLELEITESIANNGIDNISEILTRLKSLGVKLSIDDFGTEYSSLGRLRQLPVDSLKMDIQFVRGIQGTERDQAITKVIISLAKSLHLRLTAEGVETRPELEFLSQRMCDEVQGYYYYRPMPVEDAEQVLRGCVESKG